MILLALAAFTMSPSLVSAQEEISCAEGTMPVLIDDAPHCAIQDSSDTCPVNDAGVPGILVEIDGAPSCAHGVITDMEGADILAEQPQVQPEEKLLQNDPFAGLSCPDEGFTLVMLNGQPQCKGPTEIVCDADELKALIPAGAFNEVWLADKCVWQYELAN
jgi:hypothetical protein